MPEIIVALDGMKLAKAVKLAKDLKGHVWGFKFNDLAVWLGTSVVRKFKQYGCVFADPKLYDTPETVANSVYRFSKAGADIITVHAAGGQTMMREAVAAAGSAKIAAVTALTSMSQAEVIKVFDTNSVVYRLATLAQQAGVHGIVCPGNDSHNMRMLFKDKFLIVPGVRPWAIQGKDFQTQVTSGKGVEADYLVVGRIITQAEDPVLVVDAIKEIFS